MSFCVKGLQAIHYFHSRRAGNIFFILFMNHLNVPCRLRAICNSHALFTFCAIKMWVFFRTEFKNKISILNCQFMRLGLGLKIKRIMNKG